MAIVLNTETRPAVVTLQGSETFTAAAGKHVKIETSPAGEEYLDAVVPEGKTWTVSINVYVVET